MTYDIYTYGNGEIVHGVLNAIAMCLNGGSESLLEPLKRLGLLVGVFWAALYALYGEGIKVMTHWIVPMTIMMNILFVPKTSVWIHDPITHFNDKVDNVPYGLAAAAGYISIIGHTLTVQVEKVFTLPDDLKYHRSGALFASNLIQKAKTFRITNANMADNMRGFVEQCVVYDVMLGTKYTLEDLRTATDIWDLVSSNASPARSFTWRDTNKAAPRIVTCKEGAVLLSSMWGNEMTQASNVYSSLWGKKADKTTMRVELLSYMPLAYQVLGDISKSANDILKQNMMIYAVVDAVDGKSSELGNAPNFAARRAYLQQRSTYETLGAMAGDMLPTMKAVLEAIAYACFLFVIPMSLLPFGWTFLLRWGQILLWLQMWAPLSAVLNYIMTMAARSQSLSALGGSEAITIANTVAVCDANADITAMAGYLAMSLPFLSIALVKGVGSFVHMATHLGAVSQSAAGTAAGEITSGNLSYGNVSEGNVQIANNSMLQQGRAARLSSAGITFDDGRTQTTFAPSGDVIASVGMSSLPVSIHMAETQSQQLSEAASYHTQTGIQLAESASSHIASSYRQLADLSESFSHDEGRQRALSQGVSEEQMQSVRDAVSIIQSYAKDVGISYDESASIFASTPLIGAQANLSNSEKEQLAEAKKYSDEHHLDESMRQALHTSRTISQSSSDQTTKRLAESVTGSWERGGSERQEASKNFSEAESYNQQAQYVLAQSSTINRNASQELLEYVAASPAEGGRNGEAGSHETVGWRAASHILSRDDEVSREYVARFMEHKGYGGHAIGQSEQQLAQKYHQQEIPHSVNQQDYESVRQQGQTFSSSAPNSDERFLFPNGKEDKPEWARKASQNMRQEGEAIQQQYQEEQKKSVVRRTAEKVDQIVFPPEKMKERLGQMAENKKEENVKLKGEPQQG